MFLAFWYPIFFCPEKWFFGDTNSNLDLRISSLNTHLRSSNWSLASYICFLSRDFVGWIEFWWPNIFSSWMRQKSWSAMWAVVTVVFSGFSAAYCSFNTKEKKSADSEWKRDLRMSSFTTVLRSTNWASGRYTVVLSDRFVWWSDCLWFFSC